MDPTTIGTEDERADEFSRTQALLREIRRQKRAIQRDNRRPKWVGLPEERRDELHRYFEFFERYGLYGYGYSWASNALEPDMLYGLEVIWAPGAEVRVS